jgi:hypothetical protein
LKKLKEEIDKLRENPEGEDRPSLVGEPKPRRVSDTEMFLKIHAMKQKGGSGDVPLC